MTMLTRKERRELDPAAKKALRVARRAERAKSRGKPQIINLAKLTPLAEALILELAGTELTAEDRIAEVMEELVESADEFMVWGAFGVFVGGALGGPIGALLGALVANGVEAADGLVLRVVAHRVLEPEVQRIYDRLKADGSIARATEE